VEGGKGRGGGAEAWEIEGGGGGMKSSSSSSSSSSGKVKEEGGGTEEGEGGEGEEVAVCQVGVEEVFEGGILPGQKE